jgi:hypothetical protein
MLYFAKKTAALTSESGSNLGIVSIFVTFPVGMRGFIQTLKANHLILQFIAQIGMKVTLIQIGDSFHLFFTGQLNDQLCWNNF